MGRPLADCHHLFGGASEPAGRDAVNAVNAVNGESHGDFGGNHGDTPRTMGKIMGKSMVNLWKMEIMWENEWEMGNL